MAEPNDNFSRIKAEVEARDAWDPEQLRNELLAAIRKKEIETGKTLTEVLVDSAYSEDKQEQREALDIISDILLTDTRH